MTDDRPDYTPETVPDHPMQIGKILNAVIKDIGTLEKDGFNSHFDYAYASIDQIRKQVGNAAAKHGLLIIPDELEYSKNGNLTTVELLVTFMNAENPNDKFTTRWVGTATDSADKGHAKATTDAIKRCYINTFMLVAGDVDADQTSELYRDDKLTTDQQNDILDKLEVAGKELEPVLDYFKYDRLEDVPANLYNRIVKAIEKTSSKK